MRERRQADVRALCCLLVLSLAGSTACNPFSAPTREEARAVVTTEREVEVRIVTSRQFGVTETGGIGSDPDVALEEADTSVVVPRYDETFDIRDTRRFFILVEPTDSSSVQATLEVFIDGESLGRLEGDLQEEPLQDVFVSVEF